MEQTQPVTNSAAAQTDRARNSSSRADPSEAGGVISSDFETFLRMLTTQVTNQDPLEPMDSSDFAVQLATFSGVEQQVLTNQRLEALTAQLGGGTLGQMAGWIGHDVRAEGPGYFAGDPVRLSLPDTTGADRAALVVRDAEGNELDRKTLAPGAAEAVWTGRTASGDSLPQGSYSFEVDLFENGEHMQSDTAQPYSRVVEVRSGPEGAVLVLEGGVTRPASEVTALRLGESEPEWP